MNSDNATGYNITSEEEEYVNPGMSLRLYISGFLIRLVQTLSTFWWQRLLHNKHNVVINKRATLSHPLLESQIYMYFN